MATMNPAAMAAPAVEEAAPAGYTICINVGGDGQMSVGVEPLEADEAQAYKPVQGFKGAIEKAMEIYEAGGAPMPEGEEDFQAGLSAPR